MSYFIKVDASRLKQCPKPKKKMEALKYTIDFVKTCNLEMSYLVFGIEVNLRHLILFFSKALFIHFYNAIDFHYYEIYILMMSIEASWFAL
jgi:hypothetical protein